MWNQKKIACINLRFAVKIYMAEKKYLLNKVAYNKHIFSRQPFDGQNHNQEVFILTFFKNIK